ncbi:MAG: hypothetical protein DRO67_02890, partial [Candidatus Asgardarchaeum californiense]
MDKEKLLNLFMECIQKKEFSCLNKVLEYISNGDDEELKKKTKIYVMRHYKAALEHDFNFREEAIAAMNITVIIANATKEPWLNDAVADIWSQRVKIRGSNHPFKDLAKIVLRHYNS